MKLSINLLGNDNITLPLKWPFQRKENKEEKICSLGGGLCVETVLTTLPNVSPGQESLVIVAVHVEFEG